MQSTDTRHGHFIMSIIKSMFRIVAGVTMMYAAIIGENIVLAVGLAGMFLVIAEAYGILEEFT